MKHDFSHLRHITESEWQGVRAVINAPMLAAGWHRAFELAKSGKAPAAPTAKPTRAVESWDRAFEKAGAVRRK
jgi:hypothetical protein